MTLQPSNSPQNPAPNSITEPARLPARLLKAIVAVLLVLSLMFWVVRSGAMRSYEQPAQDTEQGDHQSDRGLQGTQNDRGATAGVSKP